MDRRLLDIPVLVPKAFERHIRMKRLFPSPFCRQPMHRGQGVEHEVRAEVKVEPLAFRILSACLDVVVLRGQMRLHVQELVPFQPFWHRSRGNGGGRKALPPLEHPTHQRPACRKGENHNHAVQHALEGRGKDASAKLLKRLSL